MFGGKERINRLCKNRIGLKEGSLRWNEKIVLSEYEKDDGETTKYLYENEGSTRLHLRIPIALIIWGRPVKGFGNSGWLKHSGV